MTGGIYRSLAEGGGFSLPYLLHLYTDDREIELFVINDNEDLEYNGHNYERSNFTYTPARDADSNLEIEIPEHDKIIDILESSYFFHVEVVGIFYDGTVVETGHYNHMYGEGTWTGKSLQMKLKKDDRLEMTFPALIFNTYNNRGNS